MAKYATERVAAIYRVGHFQPAAEFVREYNRRSMEVYDDA